MDRRQRTDQSSLCMSASTNGSWTTHTAFSQLNLILVTTRMVCPVFVRIQRLGTQGTLPTTGKQGASSLQGPSRATSFASALLAASAKRAESGERGTGADGASAGAVAAAPLSSLAAVVARARMAAAAAAAAGDRLSVAPEPAESAQRRLNADAASSQDMPPGAEEGGTGPGAPKGRVPPKKLGLPPLPPTAYAHTDKAAPTHTPLPPSITSGSSGAAGVAGADDAGEGGGGASSHGSHGYGSMGHDGRPDSAASSIPRSSSSLLHRLGWPPRLSGNRVAPSLSPPDSATPASSRPPSGARVSGPPAVPVAWPTLTPHDHDGVPGKDGAGSLGAQPMLPLPPHLHVGRASMGTIGEGGSGRAVPRRLTWVQDDLLEGGGHTPPPLPGTPNTASSELEGGEEHAPDSSIAPSSTRPLPPWTQGPWLPYGATAWASEGGRPQRGLQVGQAGGQAQGARQGVATNRWGQPWYLDPGLVKESKVVKAIAKLARATDGVKDPALFDALWGSTRRAQSVHRIHRRRHHRHGPGGSSSSSSTGDDASSTGSASSGSGDRTGSSGESEGCSVGRDGSGRADQAGTSRRTHMRPSRAGRSQPSSSSSSGEEPAARSTELSGPLGVPALVRARPIAAHTGHTVPDEGDQVRATDARQSHSASRRQRRRARQEQRARRAADPLGTAAAFQAVGLPTPWVLSAVQEAEEKGARVIGAGSGTPSVFRSHSAGSAALGVMAPAHTPAGALQPQLTTISRSAPRARAHAGEDVLVAAGMRAHQDVVAARRTPSTQQPSSVWSSPWAEEVVLGPLARAREWGSGSHAQSVDAPPHHPPAPALHHGAASGGSGGGPSTAARQAPQGRPPRPPQAAPAPRPRPPATVPAPHAPRVLSAQRQRRQDPEGPDGPGGGGAAGEVGAGGAGQGPAAPPAEPHTQLQLQQRAHPHGYISDSDSQPDEQLDLDAGLEDVQEGGEEEDQQVHDDSHQGGFEGDDGRSQEAGEVVEEEGLARLVPEGSEELYMGAGSPGLQLPPEVVAANTGAEITPDADGGTDLPPFAEALPAAHDTGSGRTFVSVGLSSGQLRPGSAGGRHARISSARHVGFVGVLPLTLHEGDEQGQHQEQEQEGGGGGHGGGQVGGLALAMYRPTLAASASSTLPRVLEESAEWAQVAGAHVGEVVAAAGNLVDAGVASAARARTLGRVRRVALEVLPVMVERARIMSWELQVCVCVCARVRRRCAGKARECDVLSVNWQIYRAPDCLCLYIKLLSLLC